MLAGIVVFAMVAAGLWLMEKGAAEPAARATGQAPDPTEESEARAHWHAERGEPRSRILAERPGD